MTSDVRILVIAFLSRIVTLSAKKNELKTTIVVIVVIS